jgi:LytR cell envelope-related transcriptional attenuator
MMAALPYALSVHHFVSQVGDYVGFAAIVAVAIMVLLLFAHARETAELRRRAEYAEDELALLHEQVDWLHEAQQPGVGSPGAVAPGGVGQMPSAVALPPGSATGAPGGRSAVGAVAGAGTVAGAAALATGAGTASATRTGTVAPVPAPASAAHGRAVVFGAPLGVGAPALSSATKLIPPTDEELRAVAAAAAEPSAAADPAVLAAEAGRGGGVAAPPAPPPATAAAGANGKAPRRAGIAADPGAPGGGGRPAYPAAVTSPRRNYGAGEERSGRRRVRPALFTAVGLLVAAIVVVLVLVLGGGSSHKTNTQAAANRTSATAKAKGKTKSASQNKAKGATVKINPQTVTVAVLNGTTTANLAAAVSDKLNAKGFQQGATGNAADQTMPTTIVGYLPGDQGAKNDAYAVAVALGLKPTTVKPVSAASQSVACSGTPTNCPDQVIVTVGADLNSDAA